MSNHNESNFTGLEALDESIKSKIKKTVDKENQFSNPKDTVNNLLSAIIDHIDSKRILEIMNKDEDKSYFNEDQLEVIGKVLEIGLDFWHDPVSAQKNLFEQYDKIPNQIKMGWKETAPEFFNAAENFQFQKNVYKQIHDFNEFFIFNNEKISLIDYLKSILRDTEYEKTFSTELKRIKIISDVKSKISENQDIENITIDNSKNSYLNTAINRFLPVKYMIQLLAFVSVSNSLNEENITFMIEFNKFKKFAEIAIKDFVNTLVSEDNKLGKSRWNRRATSFPLSSELYAEDHKDKSFEDFNQQIVKNDKFSTAFERFFNTIMGEFSGTKPYKINIKSVLESLGLIEFYNYKNEKDSGLKIMITANGLEILEADSVERVTEFFSKNESLLLYHANNNYSKIEESINKTIIEFYKELDEDYEKPDIQNPTKEDNENLKKKENERNETLDKKIKENLKIAVSDLNKEEKNDSGKEEKTDSGKEEKTDSGKEEKTDLNVDALSDNSIKSIRLAALGRLQNIGMITWTSDQNFNEYKVNKEILPKK